MHPAPEGRAEPFRSTGIRSSILEHRGRNAMTETVGSTKPSRRRGELGIHSLDHLHLWVPNLADAQNFYSEFGLDVRQEGNGLGLYTAGHPQRWCTIGEGPRKKLGHLSFGVFEDDFNAFSDRLGKLGVARVDPPRGVESNGLWFHDYDGTLVEVKAAAKVSPDQQSPMSFPPLVPGTRGAPARSTAPRTRPRRLSHALLFTRDVNRAIDFYTRVLGMRLSDRSGDGIAFMHAIHGSDHHVVAFAKSNAPGHHHSSWDCASIDAIGLGAEHMRDKGFDRGWGFGRHVLGSNWFHYVRDPWGSYSEYSAGIDYVPADFTWPSADHPPEDSFYVWGPKAPEDFVHNYEA